MGHEFTNSWFDESARINWDQLIPSLAPRRALEIGSFEGASACYLLGYLGGSEGGELHCIDTWDGGIEHARGSAFEADMPTVEQRFWNNIAVSSRAAKHSVKVVAHKGHSDLQLANLLSSGRQGYFDFIYIDGSHQAPDVLSDAVLAFKLLRVGGIIAFDDYLWSSITPYGIDPLRCPKPAIDAFTNLYCRKLRILRQPLYQIYCEKVEA